jgi:hypothetical protein
MGDLQRIAGLFCFVLVCFALIPADPAWTGLKEVGRVLPSAGHGGSGREKNNQALLTVIDRDPPAQRVVENRGRKGGGRPATQHPAPRA